MKLTELKTENERLVRLREVAKNFANRARKYDEENTFPFENFRELKEINYPALTVPKKYGGLGISLEEMLRMQQIIAEYDGSTALSIGWHMGVTHHLGETESWEEEKLKSFFEDVVATGALINHSATEPATGSPTRGGRPETTATKTETGWIINGRKTFTTLSPVLDYFVVSASIDGSDDVGQFLIHRSLNGVSIEETWNMVGMRATGSHDLVLENVQVEESDYVQQIVPGGKSAQGWYLHIPACYLGIATAAAKEAISFATSYSPNSIKGTISDIPAVKIKIGEMKLKLFESETILYSIARKWDEASEDVRQTMQSELGAVKMSVVNHSLETVDLAMRIVGARSLSLESPLQRYYRDVRAGLHNPPMDDMTIMLLASEAINEFQQQSK